MANANSLGFRIVQGSNASYLVATEAREAPAFTVGTVSIYTIDGSRGQIEAIAQGISRTTIFIDIDALSAVALVWSPAIAD